MATHPFTPARRIESEFRRGIQKIASRYLNVPFSETLENLATMLSRRMIQQISTSNAQSWREAASKSSRGREIYTALRRELNLGTGLKVNELVAENAKLITSIPEKVRESVNSEIAEMQRQGLRPEEIAKYIQGIIPKLTRTHADLIARTEISKAATALTRARSEDLGINWYQWATAEDQRVRPSHRRMDKVLVNWNEAPNPEGLDGIRSTLGHYHAGNAPNCRCDALPVISLAQIAWPAQVYWNRAIRRMTRAQFAELSGIQRRAA